VEDVVALSAGTFAAVCATGTDATSPRYAVADTVLTIAS
jgi:hypothetical protein